MREAVGLLIVLSVILLCVNAQDTDPLTVSIVINTDQPPKSDILRLFKIYTNDYDAATMVPKIIDDLTGQNPLEITRKEVCGSVIRDSAAVVLIHDEEDKSLPSTVSYALGFYSVPVISVSSRDVEFSDEGANSTFLRTSPSWDYQAVVWLQLLLKLDYKKVVLISVPDGNSEALIERFFLLALQNKIEKLTDFTSKVFLLHALKNDAETILADAKRSGLMGAQSVWIVSESVLQSKRIPTGVIGIRLAQSRETSVADAFSALKNAADRLVKWADVNNFQLRPPIACDTGDEQNKELWVKTIGFHFYRLLLETKIMQSGHLVAFDPLGNRIGASFEIINVKDNGGRNVVGTYQQLKSGPILDIDLQSITWPSGSSTKPQGFALPTHLQVLTLIDPPFVYMHGPVHSESDCENIAHTLRSLNQDLVDTVPSLEREVWIPCRSATGLHCCNGYCMTLLKELSNNNYTRFSFDVTVMDVYGNCTPTDDGVDICTGLVGMLQRGEGDMAVAALDITPDRKRNIDYTKPWLYHGLTILEKTVSTMISDNKETAILCTELLYTPEADFTRLRSASGVSSNSVQRIAVSTKRSYIPLPKKNGDKILRISTAWRPIINPMESFMQPFKSSLWMCLFASVFIIGMTLFLLDRLSPFATYIMAKEKPKQKLSIQDTDPGTFDEDTPLSFSGAMWFVWGVLLDSGIGEKTPRSFSARVLGVVWCGFSMIMVASYTANLAAFLVLDQPEKKLSGITDTRLRNPSENFTFATVQASAAYSYFKRHVELSTIFRKMEGNNYKKAEDAIAAIKNGNLDAFIWDSTRLEFESERHCDLTTAGEIFGRSAYAVGLQKDSIWTRMLTLQILNMSETGRMEKLDQKWIDSDLDSKCLRQKNQPTRLGLTNMKDVFILVGGGVMLGCVFILFEFKIGRRTLRKMEKDNRVLRVAQVWRKKTAESIRLREEKPSNSQNLCNLLINSPQTSHAQLHSKPKPSTVSATRTSSNARKSSKKAQAICDDYSAPLASSDDETPGGDYGFKDFARGIPQSRLVEEALNRTQIQIGNNRFLGDLV